MIVKTVDELIKVLRRMPPYASLSVAVLGGGSYPEDGITVEVDDDWGEPIVTFGDPEDL